MGEKMDRANIFKGGSKGFMLEPNINEQTLHNAYSWGMLQCFCAAWREKTFGKFPEGREEELLAQQWERVRKEYIELATAMENYQENPCAENHEKIKKETADLVIVLFNHIADYLDFDLLFEVMQKMRTNLAREWRSNGDGTGQHTKKAPWEQETEK